MDVLLLGVGMQGKAALHDLARTGTFARIIAADLDVRGLKAHCARHPWAGLVQCEPVDADDPASVERLLAMGPAVVIDLLPARFAGVMAALAVKHGVSIVNTFYPDDGIRALAREAAARGVATLPEFGMDPGIDLVFLGHSVRALDRVEEVWSYGAGFPEPAAAGNPLRYKVTWTFEGVLKSYFRAGRFIRDGKVVEVGEREMFRPDLLHHLDLEGIGRLEAFPNGDAVKYAQLLELDRKTLRNLGRFVLRWPGHSAFWKALVDLGMLDEGTVKVEGRPVDRRKFLAASLEPLLQYGPGERDIAVLRVEARGVKNGKRVKVLTQCIDYRDLETGITAMSRTVGFTASIGAQLITKGAISKRGLLSPAKDIPFELLAGEMRKRKMQVSCEVTAWE
jgi:saccharopine dehydrogenase-like NADP-dependent oxidoreductase